MTGPLLLAIDQGTSSTKALVVDGRGAVSRAGRLPSPSQPRTGLGGTGRRRDLGKRRRVVSEALDAHTAKRVVSVGLSTQREILCRLGPPQWRGAHASVVLAGPPNGTDLRLLRIRGSGSPFAARVVCRSTPCFPLRRRAGFWTACRGHARARAAKPASEPSTRFCSRASAAKRSSRPATPRARSSSMWSGDVGRGASRDLRHSACRLPARRCFDRDRFRRRAGWLLYPMARRCARVLATRIPLCSLTASLPRST